MNYIYRFQVTKDGITGTGSGRYADNRGYTIGKIADIIEDNLRAENGTDSDAIVTEIISENGTVLTQN